MMALSAPDVKACKKCAVVKSVDDYYRNGAKTARRNVCKDCIKANRREAYELYGRPSFLRRRFGLTVEQYESMALSQAGKCAICGGTSDERMRVDHCHETGKVRGLLCHSCNVALGHFRDNRTTLLAAISYLESHDGVVSA